MAFFKLNWAERNDLQKVSFIISVIVFLSALACLIANIAIAVEADKNWQFPSVKQKVYFFVNRSFAIIFCCLIVVAEMHHLEVLRKWARGLRFYFVRGVFQVFVGFSTVSGDMAPPQTTGSNTTADAIAAVGWVLFACGILHLLLACACFKEYSLEQQDQSKQQQQASAGGSPVVATSGVVPMSSATPTAQSSGGDVGMMPVDLGGGTGSSYRI